MMKSRNPNKVREMVRLPKYEKWAFYKGWLGMNVERIWVYYTTGW